MTSDHRKVQAALAGRQAHAERLRSFQGQLIEVVGRVDIMGAGEASIDLNFPVEFVEHPTFTFGGELHENSSIQAGNYPTISVMVHRWVVKEATPGDPDQDQQLFVGATLLVVTTGLADQRQRAHFSIKARALVNPLADLPKS